MAHRPGRGTPRRARPHAARGLSQADLLAMVLVLGVVASVVFPQFIRRNQRAHASQFAANMLTVHTALERYANDNSGAFPGYLYGGALLPWACARADCEVDPAAVPDPLLRHGYLAEYPVNPFQPGWAPVCTWTGHDPRFGCMPPGSEDGGGLLIGNALSDPDRPTPDTDPVPGTLAPDGFPYYFLGDGDPATRDWIPGTFAYRAHGPRDWQGGLCSAEGPEPWCLSRRVHYDHYFLAGYGSRINPGADWLHCVDVAASHPFSSTPVSAECGDDGLDPMMVLMNEPRLWDPLSTSYLDAYPNVVLSMPSGGTALMGARLERGNPDGFVDGLCTFVPGAEGPYCRVVP